MIECYDCRFYEKFGSVAEDKKVGWCHRFPPIHPVEMNTPGEYDRFPLVNYDDWCGEFECKD